MDYNNFVACYFLTFFLFKNREGKLIVVYDYDEGLATKFCTTMMERGYDNVFMLSGGVRVAYIKFPQRLITKGTIENMEGNEKLRYDIKNYPQSISVYKALI